jgi:hypothetical protein
VKKTVQVVVWGILASIILATLSSFFNNSVGMLFLAMLMGFGFFQNAMGGMSSRAGNRNSTLYYALTVALGAPCFYITVGFLVRQEMSLELIGPYTLATVTGSLFGAKLSMMIEKMFHITTRTDQKPGVSQELSKKVILGMWAITSIIILFTSGYDWAMFKLQDLPASKWGHFHWCDAPET